MMVLKKNIIDYSKMPEQLEESEESNDNDKAISKSRKSSSSPFTTTWFIIRCHEAIKPPAKIFKETRIEILPPKQMLQRLSILIAESQACNKPENHLKKISWIPCLVYHEK